MRHRVLASIAVLLLTSAASAQEQAPKTGDAAAAQALFYEGRALAQKGRHAEACPKFEESLRLDYGIGTEFNLADCNEKLGKIATAWSGFLNVAANAKARNQTQREQVARDRARALEPRLPKLLIDVAKPVPGLEVKRDGVVVGSAAWGTPVPVDPGVHEIVATAPGKEKLETKIEATEGKIARVTIRPLAPNKVAAKAPVVLPPPPPVVLPPPAPVVTTAAAEPAAPVYFPEPVIEDRGSTQRTIGWIVTGLGAAGLGVGGAFGILSLTKRNESNQHCVGDLCNAEGVSLRDEAIDAGNVATAASIGGGAALLGGILLLVTAPSRPERSASVTPSFSVAASGGSFGLSGRLP